LFLGDYTGLAPLADGFGAALVESKPAATHGPSDVLFAHARLGKRPSALRVLAALRPRRVRAGRRVRLRVLIRGAVDGRRRPLADARIRLGRRHVTTNAKGRATVAVKLPVGRYRVRATKPGFRAAIVTLVAR
jgi:hypothetical protein